LTRYDAAHAYQVARLVSRERRVLQLGLGDLPQVPEDVRRELAVRIRANRLLDDLDAREQVAVLLHVEGDPLGDAGGDRHRLVDVVQLAVDPVRQHLGADAQDLRQVEQDLLQLVSGLLSVHGHHEAHPVIHQDVAVRVQDPAAGGGHLDRAYRVRVGRRTVLLVGQHLEEPQPRGERSEHERHQQREDLQPQPDPTLGHGTLTSAPRVAAATPAPPAAARGGTAE
jgi:hypothetical protein